MDKFIESAHTMHLIDSAIVTDGDFKDFCTALDVKPSDHYALARGQFRNYQALRRWCAKPRSCRDFAAILVRLGYQALAVDTGLGALYAEVASQKSSASRCYADQAATTQRVVVVAAAETDFVPVPLAPPNTGGNKMNPFKTKKTASTLREFVASGDAFYVRICVELNEREGWRAFLELHGMLDSEHAARQVSEWREGWKKRANNPADEMFKLLTETELADRSISELQCDLAKIQDDKLFEAVKKWKEFCDSAVDEKRQENKRAFSEAMSLRQFLLEQNICSLAEVDVELAKLTHPSIEVTTIDDLRKMTQQELQQAGWSLKKAKNCVERLKVPDATRVSSL